MTFGLTGGLDGRGGGGLRYQTINDWGPKSIVVAPAS